MCFSRRFTGEAAILQQGRERGCTETVRALLENLSSRILLPELSTVHAGVFLKPKKCK